MIEAPETIEVSETGETISPAATEKMQEIRVETHDPTAQIVVVNDKFQPVIKAAGSAVGRLPQGIYKVRVRRGASSLGFEDRLVVLDRDQTVSIDPPQLASAAPIGGSQANDAHVAAREWLDAVVHVSLGEGSKIALLARYDAPAQGDQPLIHPFSGLQLLRDDGSSLLVDLRRAMPKPYVPDNKEPIAICGIKVDPGTYTLSHGLASGQQLAQSIVATKGWQTTLSLRRSLQDISPANKLFVRCPIMALLMRRLATPVSAEPAPIRAAKDGPIDEDELVEVSRQGLADGLQWLSDHLYDLLLKDFENPLLGIIGGLLLDLEREALGPKFRAEHGALFDQAVRKLRKMIGRDHPDVEALSFRCQESALAHRGSINAAPMFGRSWRIILEAASNRHKLVPLDLWKRTMAAGSMPPYLVWSMQTSAKEKQLRNLRKLAAESLSSRIVEPWPQPSPIAERAPSASIESAPPAAIEPGRSASMAPEAWTKRRSRQEIALDLRVPVNALLQLVAPSKDAGKAMGPAAGKDAAEPRTAKKVGTKGKSAR